MNTALRDEALLSAPFALPSWDMDRFDIPIDADLFKTLSEEMAGQEETKRPAQWWDLPSSYRAGNMEGMLNPWCGDVGQLPLADPERVKAVWLPAEKLTETWEFCNRIDHLQLVKGASLQALGAMNWRVVDLFSVIDALLISAFCDAATEAPHVLEIGGGFGRTGEFLAKTLYPSMKYVNVDAVPLSLTYSYQYLRARFPDKKVSVVTRNSGIDPDSDFTVVPAWNLDCLGDRAYNLSINIESFQEMSQHIVDFYISMIDGQTVRGGYVYLTNARNYKFKGQFNFPNSWDCLYRHQSPHAWSEKHPTEIFRIAGRTGAARNRIRRVILEREKEALLDNIKYVISDRFQSGLP